MLVQQTQTYSSRLHNVALISGLLTANQTKDCALASAVATDKTNMFTWIDLQRCTAEHILRSVRFVDL